MRQSDVRVKLDDIPFLEMRRCAAWMFWICAGAVLYLSLSSTPHLPTTGWDKTNHLMAFATLGVLGLAAWQTRKRAIILGLCCYGAMIEVMQSFTATREPDWHDVVADCVGLVVAFLVVQFAGGLIARTPNKRRSVSKASR